MTVTNNEIAREFAERLLAIEPCRCLRMPRSLGHPATLAHLLRQSGDPLGSADS
ncbi:orotate phosphoribosyltransferase [Cutibacterium acnes JCM 18916]|nr:orotate phosphoribosyltransferase [Cutibacterium acnes JCM 18916]